MRLSRYLLPVAALLLASCAVDGGPVSNARPALAGVRFINALADEGPVDARMIDQVQWSAYALGINFRQAGIRMPAQAGSRPIRVWRATNDINQLDLLIEQTVDIVEGQDVTLLLTGSVQGGTARIDVIPDAVPDSSANQIHIRGVNATGAAAELSWVSGANTNPVGSVGPLSATAFTQRALGTVTAQFNAPGAPATIWSTEAPAGVAQTDNGIGATAGYRASGSALSAYLFPASVVGSRAPQTAPFAKAAVVWFVDRVPAPPR